MVVYQETSVVPFDERLERVATVTDDGETIAVEYRVRQCPETSIARSQARNFPGQAAATAGFAGFSGIAADNTPGLAMNQS